MDSSYEIAIVGGGIVGMSFAMQAAAAFPRSRLIVLEKEAGLARHQTGHNSGVIHSGVYYKPGSLKAKLCVAGAREMIQFCSKNDIPYETCGKLIVATNAAEAARLDLLLAGGEANGLREMRLLDHAAMREIEPHVGGVRALHVPSTGITDYSEVTEKYAAVARSNGVEIKIGAQVTGFTSEGSDVVVKTSAGDLVARFVVNCAGLYSDRIARMAGHEPGVMIIPFRGEYFDLAPLRTELVRGLIYPLPDPAYPFLGVHFTKRIHGNVDAGPNAVLAFRREGYRRTNFNFGEAMEIFGYSGFRAMAGKHWKNGLSELRRSWRKKEFVRSCQALVPEVQMEDLAPGGSGVRAQAVAGDGSLVDDFHFVAKDRFLHVLNVPSPAATASLPIGREIIARVKEQRGDSH
jgi:(S)-2-hydroxyglutarate dehydrogenase